MILGGVTLSDDLILDGLETHPPVVYSQRRTLGGVSIVQSAPNPGGRTLSLDSDGHLSLADVLAVRAVAEANAAVAMTHHRGSFTVKIVSVDVDPDQERSNPEADPTITYSGTITMIEV